MQLLASAEFSPAPSFQSTNCHSCLVSLFLLGMLLVWQPTTFGRASLLREGMTFFSLSRPTNAKYDSFMKDFAHEDIHKENRLGRNQYDFGKE